jgi:hypothetical protein
MGRSSVFVPIAVICPVVPEGQKIIARRFNAGFWPAMAWRPDGTIESRYFQPSLRDLMLSAGVPGVEAPGYSQEVPPGQFRTGLAGPSSQTDPIPI